MNNNYIKYKDIIDKLTIDEKISMLSGANFWNTQEYPEKNVRSIMLTDGPHGLRKQGGKADHLGLNASIPATSFPTAATIANSWDKDLVEELGRYLGREAAKENVSVLLGPGLNIKRNPLCGRNFEYFSEDPYLSGTLAGALIDGIQSHGISACPKHFAVNSQEKLRMSIDEIVDERALHEIYLEGFKIALKHNPKVIMSAYNKVNGLYANESNFLLKDILRDRYKFNGVVVTDWGGNNDRVEALKCGNQLEMPSSGGITDIELKTAYLNNEIDDELINDSVADLIELSESTLDALAISSPKAKKEYDVNKHHKKAIEIAEKSIVMLKNEILPLKNNSDVSLIGDFAIIPRYQGAGSSLINPTKLTSAVDAFNDSEFNVIGVEKGYKRYGQRSKTLCDRAVKLALKSEYVIYFLGLDEASETEGLDREHMHVNQNQIDVLEEIYKANKNIILVVSGGAPIEMHYSKYAKAILHTYLGGQGIGQAVKNIISGEVNPSGKLAETYPYKLADVLSSKYYPGNETIAEHRESIFVGYRYFETANVDVKYPFGYGLSYTEFEYSKLKIKDSTVKFKIKNIGDVGGAEIAQVYIKAIDSKIFRSAIELKGYTKVYLNAGEEKEVEVKLDDNAFTYFNTKLHDFIVEDIDYEIIVAANIKDKRLSSIIKYEDIRSEYKTEFDHIALYSSDELSDYYDLSNQKIDREQFQTLYKKELPSDSWDHTKKLTLNDTIAQLQYRTKKGRFIYKLLTLTNKFLLKINKPIPANYIYFVIYMPFRQVSRFTNQRIKESTVIKFIEKN